MAFSTESKPSELLVADLPDINHKLINIEFPGFVSREAAAIQRLGGTDALSKAHSDGRKLEMRFRPDDQFCKPAVTRTVRGTSLILKVKRRTRREASTPCHSEDSVQDVQCEYNVELMGVANKTYQFSGMADFQVLPPGLCSSGYKGLAIDPNDLQMKEPLDSDFCKRDIPSFLPPSCFSKFDRPINYVYRPFIKHSKSEDPDPAVRTVRSKRFHLAYSISFNSPDVPKEPKLDAVSAINASNPLVTQIRELFEERPLWSSMALQWKIKIHVTRIRSVLPLIAYHFSCGPYQRLWVRLGYDPRTDPSSKVHQSLDIRVPKEVAITEQQRTLSGGQSTSQAEAGEEAGTSAEYVEETAFIFYPDKIPSQRQVIYQLNDIHDTEVQQIIRRNDGKETECNEVNGWCEEHAYDKMRKLLSARMKSFATHK